MQRKLTAARSRRASGAVVQVGVAVAVVVDAVRAGAGHCQGLWGFERVVRVGTQGALGQVAPAVAVAVSQADADWGQLEGLGDVAVRARRLKVATVADAGARGPAVDRQPAQYRDELRPEVLRRARPVGDE